MKIKHFPYRASIGFVAICAARRNTRSEGGGGDERGCDWRVVVRAGVILTSGGVGVSPGGAD
jgi:hypothetical protein